MLNAAVAFLSKLSLLKLFWICMLLMMGAATMLTISGVVGRDPDTEIVRAVYHAGGDPHRTSVLDLELWFGQRRNQALAIRLGQQCTAVSRNADARWYRTTEAHICKAAIPVAAFAVLSNMPPYKAGN